MRRGIELVGHLRRPSTAPSRSQLFLFAFFLFFFCLFFFNLIGGRLTTFGLFSFLFFNGRPKKQVPIGQRSEIFVFSAIGKSGPTNDVVIN